MDALARGPWAEATLTAPWYAGAVPVEYGLRLASPGDLPRDAREACAAPWRELLPPGNLVALYFGTEFCEDRLPSLEEAIAFCSLAREHGCEPTLLTPIVSADSLDRIDRLLADLVGQCWTPAVVFNDWGVLRLLRTAHPSLPRRAGRLMNRSLRDPRAYADVAFTGATHDASRHARLRTWLRRLGVCAIETDPDLDGGYLGEMRNDALHRTLHLPFTLAASGRNCPLKAGLYPPGAGFSKVLADPCPAPCRGKPMAVQRNDTPLPFWRAGNTLFYELPPHAAREWVARSDRLVLHPVPAP